MAGYLFKITSNNFKMNKSSFNFTIFVAERWIVASSGFCNK